jgi:hypothetical protein
MFLRYLLSILAGGFFLIQETGSPGDPVSQNLKLV